MANQYVSSNVGNTKILLWSVMAMMQFPDEPSFNLSLACDLDDDGNPIPCFDVNVFDGADHLREALSKFDAVGGNIWFSSICVKYNVTNLPPYPEPSHFASNVRIMKNLEKHINGVSNFKPLKLINLNPASNTGNCRLLQQVIVDYQALIETNNASEDPVQQLPYRIYVTDVNIYPRVVQVLFVNIPHFFQREYFAFTFTYSLFVFDGCFCPNWIVDYTNCFE
jgi:hypothetical protein